MTLPEALIFLAVLLHQEKGGLLKKPTTEKSE